MDVGFVRHTLGEALEEVLTREADAEEAVVRVVEGDGVQGVEGVLKPCSKTLLCHQPCRSGTEQSSNQAIIWTPRVYQRC